MIEDTLHEFFGVLLVWGDALQQAFLTEIFVFFFFFLPAPCDIRSFLQKHSSRLRSVSYLSL